MALPSSAVLAERKKLHVGAEIVQNQQSTDFPGHWPGENHEWDLEYFKEHFNVQFHARPTPYDSSFSLSGIDTSVANAFRRIMLSEISTLAIEDVFIYQNTSIIQDEVLAHRLGLIPLCGDTKGLEWMKWYVKPTDDDEGSGGPSDFNCAILHLDVECSWQEGGLQRAVAGETDPDKLYINHSVYAKDIVWAPLGKQSEMFDAAQPIRATNPDILIVKMRPGQKITLTMHAMKGIGQDHAKFSPVATASYRLMPTIDILKPIVGADAKKFARCFPKGVIRLDKITSDEAAADPELSGHEGENKAVVDKPMNDTVSRECLRHAEFKDKVKLGRVRDHFIFRVESTGQIDSDELFLESVKQLRIKAQRIKRGLEIQVHANEGGVTQTRGGVYWLILPAGYLGSSFWGMALILASTNLITARIAAGCLAVALLIVLFIAQNWTLRGLCIGFIFFLAIVWVLQEKTTVRILRYVILFIGVMNSLFSVYDIYDDLISRRVNSSDAEKFAEVCPCPCNGVGWGVIWGMISFLFLSASIYLGLVILS